MTEGSDKPDPQGGTLNGEPLEKPEETEASDTEQKEG